MSTKNKTRETELSRYIDGRLWTINSTWNKIFVTSGLSRTMATRVRREAYIPSPSTLTKLAAALGCPWTDLWKVSGYINEEHIKAISQPQSSQHWLYRLNIDEAELITAYRSCGPDSQMPLKAAVRGSARASEHVMDGDDWTRPENVIRITLDLNFVNKPDYIETNDHFGVNVPTNNPKNYELSYESQAALVGVLRWSRTGVMSGVPRRLWEPVTDQKLSY